MSRVRDDAQRRFIASIARRGAIGAPESFGHYRIAGAAYEMLRHAERQELDGRGDGVTLGNLRRGASEKLGRHVVADAVVEGSTKVVDPCQRDDAFGCERFRASNRRVRELRARSRPKRQVPAGGVAHHDDAAEIERVLLAKPAKMVDAGAYVQERSRPTAARIADPAILDSPSREAVPRQRVAEATNVVDGVLRAPAAAMNDDDDGVRSSGFGKPQISELQRIAAIGDPCIGSRIGQLQDFVDGDEWRLQGV